MLYCRDCGSITEGEYVKECMLPEVPGEQPACYDHYMVCSECGSADIEDAQKCPVCGKYFERDMRNICGECGVEIFEGFWSMMNTLMENHPTASRGDIVEGMAEEFETFYDKYRF